MTTDIITTVNANPVSVLIDEKTYSDFYARMKAECDEFVPDLSTVTSRAKISAQAYKVTRTKTAINAAGKKLNEDARAKIAVVDASRRKIREELDALADAVRKPLTDWETAEKQRVSAVAEVREWIRCTLVVAADANVSSEQIKRDIERVDLFETFHLGVDIDAVEQEKADAIMRLDNYLASALQREADAAELTRLRAEAEEREIAERERIEAERIAKEAAEREREEREAAEAKAANDKLLAEVKERDRLASIDRDKQDQMEHDRLRKVRQEKEIETARNEALAKAQREHAEQLAKIEAENRRLADAEAARLAEIERTKREEDARAADRKHRGEVMKAAKEAMMSHGADEAIAKAIVLAIIANDIPNVRMQF